MQNLVEKYVAMRRAIKAEGKLNDGMDWLFTTIINDLKETAVAIDNAIDVKNKRVADAEGAAEANRARVVGLERQISLLADRLDSVEETLELHEISEITAIWGVNGVN